MKRQKFVYNAHAGDNTKFVYIPEMKQKANFVYKELSAIRRLSTRTAMGTTQQIYLTSANEEK